MEKVPSAFSYLQGTRYEKTHSRLYAGDRKVIYNMNQARFTQVAIGKAISVVVTFSRHPQ